MNDTDCPLCGAIVRGDRITPQDALIYALERLDIDPWGPGPLSDAILAVLSDPDYCPDCRHPWAAHTEVTNDGCQYEECDCDEQRERDE